MEKIIVLIVVFTAIVLLVFKVKRLLSGGKSCCACQKSDGCGSDNNICK